MQKFTLGTSNLKVSRIAYGCMLIGGSRQSGPPDEKLREAAFDSLDAALECGIDFFDHADIYAAGKSEMVFGRWLAANPGLRDRITIQTKCGIRWAGEPEATSPQRFDFSFEHITRSVDSALQRLGIDCIDVLLLHRPDPLVEPEDVARAFDAVASAGKVRHFGVSNHSAAQIELLRRYVRQPLVANQVEISLLHLDMIDAGIYWNHPGENKSATGDGTLEYCRQHNITPQAWSPMARGLLSGRPAKDDDPRKLRIASTSSLVAELAKDKGVSAEAIVIAWLLRHPAMIQPIIGTRDAVRIAAAAQATKISLSRDEWYRLYAAARGRAVP